PALSVGVDTYYKMVRELLDEGQFGQALIFTPFNYNKGRVYGIELSTAYHEGPFSAYSNLAVSRAQGTQINSAQFNLNPASVAYTQDHYIYLDHDQRVSGSAGLSYLWQGTTYSLADTYGSGLRAQVTSAIPNGDKLPFYNQLDVAAERSVNPSYMGPLKLRLAVINLLDSKYAIRDGSGVGVGAPQFGPRAGVFVGIQKPF
ncbi:MAG: TonB-dependent receptor, partial [Stenotrophobium sp.]